MNNLTNKLDKILLNIEHLKNLFKDKEHYAIQWQKFFERLSQLNSPKEKYSL